jgi:DNA-binding transcriptional regulator GbsR (MarR family)
MYVRRKVGVKAMAHVSKLTAAKPPGDALAAALGPAGRRFVLHWGEMGWRWGVNRTVAQLHAALFLLGRPMHAEEIAELLQVARSNVSTSLRELENWKLVRVVHLPGDRRDHFETAQDPWELMRIIVRERKAREFDPTLAMLRECVSDPGLEKLGAGAQKRVRDTLTLMESLSRWTDEMLNLETPTLTRLVRLGARVQSFLRGKAS